MCGLVGVIGTINHREKQAFKWLLHFDATRGEHSTGVLAVAPDNTTQVFKELGTSGFLYQKFEKEFPKGVYDKPVKVLLGHNRFATQGEVIAENAHPFEFENVIGAHNGTVVEWSTRKLHMSDKFQIDSQKIYSQLNFDQDVQKLWEHLEDSQNSAASLSYWDKRDASLNFVRNSQRPMYFAVTKDQQTMFWASEKWMLQIACGQSGIQIADPEASEIHQHYRFSLKEGKLIVSKKAVEEKKWFPSVSSTYMGYGTNTKHTPKYVDVRIDHIVQNEGHPAQIVMTKIGVSVTQDVVCIPPATEVEEVVALVKEYYALHKKVYEGDVSFLMEESWFFSAPGTGTLRLGAYRLIREMKDGIDLLNWELTNNGNDSSPTYEELPPHAVVQWVDGSPITGRSLKKALKAAGNCCGFCGVTNLKRGEVAFVHGGKFLTEKDFVCGECVADGVVFNFVKQN